MDKKELNKTISYNKVNIRKDQLSLQSAPVSEEIKKVLQETKEEKETKNQITKYLNFVEDSFQKCFLSK